MKHTTAIIVAAGSSRRMGFNKLTADLLGKPVLRRTLEAFDACPEVQDLLIVVGEATRPLVQSWLDEGAFHKPVILSEGGAERYLSVHEGLLKLPHETEIVAVHDGARPLINVKQITRCIEKAAACGAVACARPVTETLKRVNEIGVIVGSVERENTWIMETPQVFDRSLLCDAYERVVQEGLQVTDEVSAVQHHGVDVFLLENPLPNLKITYPSDLDLAAKLLLP
ncbi:MAG: 2-C-methyl-D-erythritol 4-phosphate cytidylyltransferase [Verrucomicrobiota bacterium]|jgi:2-C-methyl-D-erythritol 4-phosphate cytidylyltransferase